MPQKRVEVNYSLLARATFNPDTINTLPTTIFNGFMMQLATTQPGFLGVESAREDVGITISYWSDFESIQSWRDTIEHQVAGEMGHTQWYSSFKLLIAKVEREYGM